MWKRARTLCASVVILASLSLVFSACREEIKPKENSINQKENHSTMVGTIENDSEKVAQTAENDSEEVTQPSDMDIENILLQAHQREGMEQLYEINPEENLSEWLVRNEDFTDEEIEAVKQVFPDDYKVNPDIPRSFQGNNGRLYIKDNLLVFNTLRWQGDPEVWEEDQVISEGTPGYLDTIILLRAHQARRVFTCSQNENFPFMSRAEAKQMADKLFADLGYNNLTLRGMYSVRQAETGKPFYYLQYMQNLQGVPLADEENMPYFPVAAEFGFFCKISCAIDEEGIAYVSGKKINFEVGAEEFSVISREEMGAIVQERLDGLIDAGNGNKVLDSIELHWGSEEPLNFNANAPQEYRLVPYYLVILRVPNPPVYGEGYYFERWFFDAQTGEQL